MAISHLPAHAQEGVLDERRFEGHDLRALLALLGTATRLVADGDAALRRAGADFTLVEFDALAFVYVAGSMRPSDILRRAALSASPATLHNVIKRLEKRGLVRRKPHPDDARGVLIEITDEGRSTLERTYPLIERQVLNRFSSQYSAEELLVIAGLLQRVHPPPGPARPIVLGPTQAPEGDG
jgi:DNA-binding MarR family transcriptional regulator